MAITQEIWENHIEGNLFQDNEFLTASRDESEYVVGKVVHSPQAGSTPNVVVNRNSFPASATQRTDTTNDWTIDDYSTDPIFITDAEAAQLSYNKRESILMEHEQTLRQKIANNTLVKWAASGQSSNILRTSGIKFNDQGAAPVSSPAYTSAAAGNRLNCGMYDIMLLQRQFDAWDIPSAGRCAILDAFMYQQLLQDMSGTQFRDFIQAADPKTGVIGSLYGFKFYKRSSVLTYDNSGTPAVKAVGAAGAASDNAAGLFWHPNYVKKALGDIKAFEQQKSPLYYGDVYSFMVLFGGQKSRTDEKGVMALVQNVAA